MSIVRLVHPASCPLEGLDATLELCSSVEHLTSSLVRRFNLVFQELTQRLETLGRRLDQLENQLCQLPLQANKVVTLSHPEVCPWRTTIESWAPSMAPLLDFTEPLDCCREGVKSKCNSGYVLPAEEFDLQKALHKNKLPLTRPVSFAQAVEDDEDVVQLKYLSDLFIFNSTKTRYEKRSSNFSGLLSAPIWLSTRPDSPSCRHGTSSGSLLISAPVSPPVVAPVNSKENEIPQLKLPEGLPHLPGISFFSDEISVNSVTKKSVPSVHEVVESSNFCTVVETPVVHFENESTGPPVPAPPPPPLPAVVQPSSAPVPLTSPSRVDLMASIREAGGIERFNFKCRRQNQLRASVSSDPAGDLKTAMAKRRKEIMGQLEGTAPLESAAEVLLRRLSVNIPPKEYNGGDGESSSKSSSDDEWSN
uniref:WASP family protein member n=1 Tax=Trichuris muris TaxID=70415 RepID=A0A5S6R152_TRIMR